MLAKKTVKLGLRNEGKHLEEQKRRRSRLLAALKACTSSKDLEGGKQIHYAAIESGEESNIYVATTLVDMYAKCGRMSDARAVFDSMHQRNVVSWNALILGYADNGEGHIGLQLFTNMCCPPDVRTFVAALKSCGTLAAKEMPKMIDGKPVKVNFLTKTMDIHCQATRCTSDIYVANTLIDVYSKCGSISNAHGVFDRMPHHDVVSWTSLILGCAENGEEEIALQLFTRMRPQGCASAVTFVAATKACTNLAAKEDAKLVDGKLVKVCCLEKGMAIHSQTVECGYALHTFIASNLVEMYAKCGSMWNASKVFDEMAHHDVVSWTSFILGYTESGEGELALKVFERMQSEGCMPNFVTFLAALKACATLAAKEDAKQVNGKLVKIESLEKGVAVHSLISKSGCESNGYVASALVDMYAKCGSMVNARKVFDMIERKDVVSWTALVLGYAENGEGELSLQVFARMRPEGIIPDAVAFTAALKACGNMAALEVGKAIHAEICKHGLSSNPTISSCLIGFYGKCGSMIDAQNVFNSAARRDLAAWNALIGGYTRQGNTKRVLDMFKMMRKERVQANGITFISVLSMCSHSGLVVEGKEYFQIMCTEYGITPNIEHYTCVIDLLGRANQLDDALEVVHTMPCEPNLVTWTTILAACRKWKNVAVGRIAFESLLKLDAKESATYVLMANIYGNVGMWEEKAKVEAMRMAAKAWKKPGQSWWTDHAGTVHTFLSGDKTHPQIEGIQAKLKKVLVKMKEQGYVADVSSVLRDISDVEKEDVLCGHSERLAIACALINTAEGEMIRIVKNLRVCDDCHRATAFISNIEGRSIICRDASRFHVFKDGKCSCRNFW